MNKHTDEIFENPNLRAGVSKYRPEVCKMKKSKIPKIFPKIGFGELSLGKI
jgi:hypothetical protein